MKKIIIKLILFLLLFSNNLVFSEIISKIEVTGNKRISKESILVFGEIDLNKDYSNQDLNNILKNLYSTDFFKIVDLKTDSGTLYINIEENPIVQNLIINGLKAKKFEEKLQEVLNIKERSSFIESKVKKDVNTIENTFKTSGYYFVNVDVKIIKNNNNTVDLIYDIDLGDKAKISKIKFLGDKIYKDRKLLNIITSEEDKFWKFISDKKYLNEDRVNLDKRLLEGFYKNKGYFEVIIENSYANFLDNKSFELIFNIKPGKKFYFNTLTLHLPKDYNREYFAKIDEILQSLTGEIYSRNDIEKILANLDKIALQKEYQFINAKISEKIMGDKLDFDIFIEDSDKVYVERINIFGNTYTLDQVVRNNLLIDEGDPFNKILHSRSVNNLKSLRIFKKVDSKIVNGSTKNQKIIEIEIEEMPTGEITAGAGVGTSGNNIGFGIKEKNYLGRGITLDANIILSDEAIKGSFAMVNPNYKNTDRSLITKFESTTLDRLTDFGYETTKYGFSLGTTYEQYEDIYFSPSLSFYYEDLTTTSSASDNLKKQSGEYTDGIGSYTFTLDKRDQKFRTTEGHKAYFSQALPIISDDGTLINTFEYQKYHQFVDEMVGRLAFYLRSVSSITDDDVRVSKRTFLPSRKLRGFEPGKIGPVDSNDFIGGNYSAALNFSSDIPFLLSGVQTTDFKFFIDAANVWGVDYSDSIDDSNKIRSSTGISVDWFTPIGPLNFSLAKPITKASTDKTESFRFNLGTTF